MGKGRAFTFKEKLKLVRLIGKISSIYSYIDCLLRSILFKFFIICNIIFILIKHGAPHIKIFLGLLVYIF